jgi:hypothetical protein
MENKLSNFKESNKYLEYLTNFPNTNENKDQIEAVCLENFYTLSKAENKTTRSNQP